MMTISRTQFRDLFGTPPRSDDNEHDYGARPMVVTSWTVAAALGARLSSGLPTASE